MTIVRAATQISKRGPAEYFTGPVWIDEIAVGPNPPGMKVARVTFAPGARTAWHTHPHGQTLQILSGRGRVQKDGGPVTEVNPGDIVWFEPGERHWHGASAQTGMVHLALQQTDATGVGVSWLQHVTEAEYLG